MLSAHREHYPESGLVGNHLVASLGRFFELHSDTKIPKWNFAPRKCEMNLVHSATPKYAPLRARGVMGAREPVQLQGAGSSPAGSTATLVRGKLQGSPRTGGLPEVPK